MKQGSASSNRMAGAKVEPKPKGYTPGYASRIGIQQTYTETPKVTERGFTAPAPVAKENFKRGSQGKY